MQKRYKQLRGIIRSCLFLVIYSLYIMITQEVIAYVVNQINQGVSLQVIRNNLYTQGWNSEDVDIIFDHALNRTHVKPTSNSIEAADASSQTTETPQENIEPVENPILQEEDSSDRLASPSHLFGQTWKLFTSYFWRLQFINFLPFILMTILGFAFVTAWGLFSSATNLTPEGIMSLLQSPLMLLLSISFLIVFTFVSLFVGLVQQMALLYFAANAHTGISVWKAYGIACKKFWTYLWANSIASLIVLTGFLLFIIPGIFFAVIAVFVLPIVMLEDEKGVKAFIKSREYVRDNWWKTVGRFAFLHVCLLTPVLISLAITWFVPFGNYLGQIINLLITPLPVLFAFVLYKALQNKKPTIDQVVQQKSRGGYITLAVIGGVLMIAALTLPLVSLVTFIRSGELAPLIARDFAVEESRDATETTTEVSDRVYVNQVFEYAFTVPEYFLIAPQSLLLDADEWVRATYGVTLQEQNLPKDVEDALRKRAQTLSPNELQTLMLVYTEEGMTAAELGEEQLLTVFVTSEQPFTAEGDYEAYTVEQMQVNDRSVAILRAVTKGVVTIVVEHQSEAVLYNGEPVHGLAFTFVEGTISEDMVLQLIRTLK